MRKHVLKCMNNFRSIFFFSNINVFEIWIYVMNNRLFQCINAWIITINSFVISAYKYPLEPSQFKSDPRNYRSFFPCHIRPVSSRNEPHRRKSFTKMHSKLKQDTTWHHYHQYRYYCLSHLFLLKIKRSQCTLDGSNMWPKNVNTELLSQWFSTFNRKVWRSNLSTAVSIRLHLCA